MQNFKVILEYDGSEFFGFQKQPGKPTIQQALEDALSKLFNQKLKIASASGRTDTGVHALAQVVNFKVATDLKPERILRGLNFYLPKGISVKKVNRVSFDFHARFQAKSKIYEYLVWNHSARSPLWARRSYHVPQPLNMEAMKKSAAKLLGRHDFKAFAAQSGFRKRSDGSWKLGETARNLKVIRVSKRGSLIRFSLEADGFLHHMVRNVVGTLLEAGAGRMKPEAIKNVLKSGERSQAGMKLPAQGLTLVQVRY